MNKHLKPDRNTNLNNPRSEVDRSDCNLRLGWSSMEQKIEFSMAKSGFRLEHNQDVHRELSLLVARCKNL